MRRCYHCQNSFVHEGDPVDGNDFCNHICSGNYIRQVAREHHVGEVKNEKTEEVQAEVERDPVVRIDGWRHFMRNNPNQPPSIYDNQIMDALLALQEQFQKHLSTFAEKATLDLEQVTAMTDMAQSLEGVTQVVTALIEKVQKLEDKLNQ